MPSTKEQAMQDYTILLVDDEPNIIRSLKRLFRSERVNILTAENGLEALQIVKNRDIQVLLTDNIMPEMTGIELMMKVRDCSPDTVRIILSGHSDIDAVLEAVNNGEAFRFMLKPWNDMDLKATVSLALAHYKLVADNKRMLADLKEKEALLDAFSKEYPDEYKNLIERTGSGTIVSV